jgi:glycine/D-amino acid oxidase-like deaminating enzyme
LVSIQIELLLELLVATVVYYLLALQIFTTTFEKIWVSSEQLRFTNTLDEMDRIEATTPEAVSRIGALRIGELNRGEDSEELIDTYAHRDALLADGFPVEDYEGEQGIGILIPTDGTFHPAKRAVLLAKLAQAAGAQIFTHSPAIKIESGLVTTEHGSIKAKHIVVAVDGNLGKALPEIADQVQPTRLQMISTAPETKTQDEIRGLCSTRLGLLATTSRWSDCNWWWS